MNVELNNALQSCVDSCDELLRMTEQDRDRIRGCMSGELMNVYLQGCAKSEEKLKTLRERLLGLQVTAQMTP